MKNNIIFIIKVVIFIFVSILMFLVMNIFVETDIDYKNKSRFDAFVSNLDLLLIIIGLLVLVFKILFLPNIKIKDYIDW